MSKFRLIMNRSSRKSLKEKSVKINNHRKRPIYYLKINLKFFTHLQAKIRPIKTSTRKRRFKQF